MWPEGGSKRPGGAHPGAIVGGSLRIGPDRIILGELRGEREQDFPRSDQHRARGSFTNHPCGHCREGHRPLAIMVMAARAGYGVRGGEAVLRGKRGLGGAAFAAGRARGGGDGMYVRVARAERGD